MKTGGAKIGGVKIGSTRIPPGSSFLHPLLGARAIALARIVRRHGGASGAGIARLAPVLAIEAVRWPNCAREAARLGDLDAIALEEPPVFIVGHWRSGTTLLHNLLACDERFCFPRLFDVLSPSEFFPSPLERWTLPLLWKMIPSMRPMDETPLRPELPQEEEIAMAALGAPSFLNCIYFPRQMSTTFAAEVLFEPGGAVIERTWEHTYRRYVAKLSLRYPGRRLLLKNPANSARLARLRRLYPGARFLHIHRHPFEVFSSTCRFYERMLSILALQQSAGLDIGGHVMWAYESVMRSFFHASAAMSEGEMLQLSYADLLRGPTAALQRIYAWLGYTLTPQLSERVAGFLGQNAAIPAPAEDLPDTLRRELFRRWRDAFERLDYSPER